MVIEEIEEVDPYDSKNQLMKSQNLAQLNTLVDQQNDS